MVLRLKPQSSITHYSLLLSIIHEKMNRPPLLLGSVLLFWGWQSHLLPFAFPMALLLEGAHWVRWRLALSDQELNRVADFSSLLLIVTVVYLFVQQSIYGLTTLLTWLPILFFLLMAAQIYSASGTLRLSSLFLSLRNLEATGKKLPYNQRVDLSYPYMMGCLLSASTSKAPWFFVGTCLLVAWGLWSARSPRYSTKVWATLLLTACLFAYFTQLKLYELQTQVETLVLSWFDQQWYDRDPYQRNTAIGDIGKLKQSDQIVLRVRSPQPVLLREASYITYHRGTWHTGRTKFSPVIPNSENQTTWTFTPIDKAQRRAPIKPLSTIQISRYLYHSKGMLALPNGTYQVANLPVLTMQRNDFGAVKVEEGPGLIEYTAITGPNTPLDAPPTYRDLDIFSEDRPIFMEVANRLNLPKQSPSQVLKTIKGYFTQQFQYSLNLTGPQSPSASDNSDSQPGKPKSKDQLTPLEYFFRQSHSGHCEYFATATVLLLRTVGLPARYASGYAVEEFSPLEKLYVVRQRHAHAWTLVYLNGHWQELDTTPPDWNDLEAEQATWYQPLSDLWSWSVYQLTKWRWQQSDSSNHGFLWLLIPLSLILVWRIYKQEKVVRSKISITTQKPTIMGTDSAFYRVIQQLNAAGYVRLPGETLTTWLTRIQVEMPTMLSLHLRYRFDPVGISTPEQVTLIAEVEEWLIMNNEQ